MIKSHERRVAPYSCSFCPTLLPVQRSAAAGPAHMAPADGSLGPEPHAGAVGVRDRQAKRQRPGTWGKGRRGRRPRASGTRQAVLHVGTQVVAGHKFQEGYEIESYIFISNCKKKNYH